MKKILVCAFSVFFAVCSSFAGDAASFDDIGFSEDGKYYLFGQYGKTDKTYEPWAEIYTVDVAANDFVKGEVFKSRDSSLDISGKNAYENLKAKCNWKISKYNAKPAGVGTLLYLRQKQNLLQKKLCSRILKEFPTCLEFFITCALFRLLMEAEKIAVQNFLSKF